MDMSEVHKSAVEPPVHFVLTRGNKRQIFRLRADLRTRWVFIIDRGLTEPVLTGYVTLDQAGFRRRAMEAEARHLCEAGWVLQRR